MELSEVLSQAIFTDLTETQCVEKLNEDVVISKDETYYTWTTLNGKLLKVGISTNIIAIWNVSIEGIVGASMFDKMLSSTGVNFALPETRGLIAQAIDSTDNADAITVLQACLDIGIKYGKLWESYFLESLPTEQDILDARTVIKNRLDVASLLNECINPLVAQSKSLSEIKDAVAAWGE